MKLIILFLQTLFFYGFSFEVSDKPAKVAIWESSLIGKPSNYKTQSIYHSDVIYIIFWNNLLLIFQNLIFKYSLKFNFQLISHLGTEAKKSEALALFIHENSNEPLLTHMKYSIDASSSATIFPYVYSSDSKKTLKR